MPRFPARLDFLVGENHVISPWSRSSILNEVMHCDTGFGSGVWVANLTTYVPFIVYEPYRVAYAWWFNGATVAGSTAVGVYSEDGLTRHFHSGAVTNSGTTVVQLSHDGAEVVLSPNRRYFMALSCNSGGAGNQAYLRADTATQRLQYCGVYQHASDYSSGLPTTATFTAPGQANMPMFGLMDDQVGAVI